MGEKSVHSAPPGSSVRAVTAGPSVFLKGSVLGTELKDNSFDAFAQ